MKRALENKTGIWIILICSFLPGFIFITACSGITGDQAQQTSTVLSNDTSIQLKVNGADRIFHVKKMKFVDFTRLQEILNTYAGREPASSNERMIDLTGDGKDETIISSIYTKQDSTIVEIKVLMNDSLMIYQDRLVMDDLYFFSEYWESDSVYYRLKPYSSYYQALPYANHIYDERVGPITGNLLDMYLTNKAYEYEQLTKDTVVFAAKKDSIITYLKNYKGKLITSLSTMDGDLLFWNQVSQQFEVLYSP